MKKILVWCLTLAMVIAMIPTIGVNATEAPDFSDYTAISTADELKAIEPGNNYYLENDIVVTTATGGWAPIAEFHSGVLDGNGHRISGINLSGKCASGTWPKSGGLFLVLRSDAVIKNLTVEGTLVEATGGTNMSEIGGIAASAAGTDILFENVTSKFSITSLIANGSVGGFVGCVTRYTDTETETEVPSNVTIRNCVNNGDLSSTSGRVGGFVGTSYGNLTVEESVNNGDIVDALYTGGFLGFIDGTAEPLRKTTFTNCFNKGNINTTLPTTLGWPSAGGFIGDTAWIAHDLTMTNCINLAKVHCNNNGGGIMGSSKVQDSLTDGDYTMKGCLNYGEVTSEASGGSGGLIKYIASCNMLFVDCVNFADMTSATSCAGLITDTKDATFTMKNCINYGDITLTGNPRSKQTGGLVTHLQNTGTVILEDCVNYGTVTAGINGWTRIAGLIGGTNDDGTLTLTVNRCANFGEVIADSVAGEGHYPMISDIIGSIGSNVVASFTACYGDGKAASLPTPPEGQTYNLSYVGPLAGRMSNATFTRCATGYFLQEETVYELDLTFSSALLPGGDYQNVCDALNEGLEAGKEVFRIKDDKIDFVNAYNKYPITMYGTQETAVNEDGTFDVRLVAIIDSADYEGAGIQLTGIANGKGITKTNYDVKTIYEELNNGLGAPKGYYFVTLTVKGISAEDTVTLMATPYVTTDDGNVMGAQATVTYTNGVRS